MGRQGNWRDERGFTLIEVMATIIVMGILFTIATFTWTRAAEVRRVDSATNQVVADLRLAHTQATNRLPNKSARSVGCDSFRLASSRSLTALLE